MKEQYEDIKCDMIQFDTEDVITTSLEDGGRV